MTCRLMDIESSEIRATLSDLGASIARVRVRNRRGAFADVALAPRSLETGEADPSLAGRTIGPCCGRVRGGEAAIGEKNVRLTRNEGENHLHGGANGCAHLRWEVRRLTPDSVLFALLLPDGLDGYPGNRALLAEYRVSGNALSVTYTASTDALTWIDLTSHVYWDLTGRFDGSALFQTLELAADRVVHNDVCHLPEAIRPVDEALSFARPCAVARKLDDYKGSPQLQIGRGLNNAYVLDAALRRRKGFSARLCAPDGGLSMTLDTDRPAIVAYTGGFLNAQTHLVTAPGVASPGCAVALEAQGLPDPFHLPGAQAALLSPGEIFQSAICWRFD